VLRVDDLFEGVEVATSVLFNFGCVFTVDRIAFAVYQVGRKQRSAKEGGKTVQCAFKFAAVDFEIIIGMVVGRVGV